MNLWAWLEGPKLVNMGLVWVRPTTSLPISLLRPFVASEGMLCVGSVFARPVSVISFWYVCSFP